ncbi:hypothetical protein Rs2_34297 [Raphanus sativus]|nr:hypothetical protein Rs2_34297 [Raphanus sativus]
MFQQVHDCDYYYDHVSFREPVYDEYKEDVVVGFHEVQSEMLRKVHDEFQKMKICMREHFRSHEATMKCMMETVTNGHVDASNISGGNKAPEEHQFKSPFVERNENHKIEMYGDPIYDKYEDDVLGFDHEGSIESQGRRHDGGNTNHTTNTKQPSKRDSTVWSSNFQQFLVHQSTQEDHCVEYVHCTPLKSSYMLHAPVKVETWVDRVVYIRLMPKYSLVHLNVSLLNVTVCENEPFPLKPPPLRDKKFTVSCIQQRN